jgi:hypothetical protein
MEINSPKMLSIVFNVAFVPGPALESIAAKEATEATLLSLTGQLYRPCELILLVPMLPKIEMKQWQNDVSERWSSAFTHIRFVSIQQELKEGACFALGIHEATGQYITFLDVGYRIYPYTYTSLVQYLQDHPQCAWAFANMGMALENEHRQVIQRIDADPSRSYVGVNYFEVDEICLPGVVIDRERINNLCNLEALLSKVSSTAATALLALQSKPGHVPILGGELRQSKEDFEKGANVIRNRSDQAILPWWLIEFQSQQLQAKEGAAIKSSIKRETTLHQQLEEMQSSYYRMLYVTYRQSTSGKITRVILRNLPWASEIHAKISQYPTSEIEAIDKIIAFQNLTLWDLTAPVRWLGKFKHSLKS